jgi:hypothetical protein
MKFLIGAIASLALSGCVEVTLGSSIGKVYNCKVNLISPEEYLERFDERLEGLIKVVDKKDSGTLADVLITSTYANQKGVYLKGEVVGEKAGEFGITNSVVLRKEELKLCSKK